jgi:antitoxin VapB
LQRVRKDSPGRLAAQVTAIGARSAALPDQDTRSADEILGYDEHGLPR